jgi:hypothetical protein
MEKIEKDPYTGMKSTPRKIIIKNIEEWGKLVNTLKGYKYSGSLESLNPNKDLTQLSNYAKFPYEVLISDKEKLVTFGDHSLKEDKPAFPPKVRQQPNPKPGEQRTYIQDPNKKPAFPPKVRQQPNPIRESEVNLSKIKDEAKAESKKCGCVQHVNKTSKGGYVIEDFFDSDTTVASFENGIQLNESANKSKMTKQDLIRIINEEINIALDEMYDPVYDSMIPEILTMLAAGGLGVKAAISHLKSKGLDKQAIIDLIRKAQSKLK